MTLWSDEWPTSLRYLVIIFFNRVFFFSSFLLRISYTRHASPWRSEKPTHCKQREVGMRGGEIKERKMRSGCRFARARWGDMCVAEWDVETRIFSLMPHEWKISHWRNFWKKISEQLEGSANRSERDVRGSGKKTSLRSIFFGILKPEKKLLHCLTY